MRIPKPSLAACKRMAALCGIAVPLLALMLWSLNTARGGNSGWSPAGHFSPLLLADIALAAPPSSPEVSVVPAVRAVPRVPLPLIEPGDGWLGIGLRCSDCSMSREDSSGVRVWRFRSAPEIRWIDPDSPADKAGVEPGDVIVKVDELPITSREAGRRFGAVKPGEKLQWTVERDGKEHTLVLVAEERPDRNDLRTDLHRELRDAQRLLDEARERVRRQLRDLDVDRKRSHRKELEEAERQMELSRGEIERILREYRTWRAWDHDEVLVLPRLPQPPEPPAAPEAPRPPGRRQNVRYEADVGEFHVEVRSTGEVGVSENQDKSEIVIKTPDSTIRVRKHR